MSQSKHWQRITYVHTRIIYFYTGGGTTLGWDKYNSWLRYIGSSLRNISIFLLFLISSSPSDCFVSGRGLTPSFRAARRNLTKLLLEIFPRANLAQDSRERHCIWLRESAADGKRRRIRRNQWANRNSFSLVLAFLFQLSLFSVILPKHG